MGAVIKLWDGLRNALTGAGGSQDAAGYRRYILNRLSSYDIDAAYRSSWLMRKAIDLPPFDMTRAWRDWQAKEDQIEAIEAEEKRLGVREKVRRALILGRLGGAVIVIGIDGDDPAQPLALDRVKQGGISYLHVMSRWQVSMDGQGIDRDPGSPTFGQPSMWLLNGTNGQARIHPSRVIAFKGQQVADFFGQADADTFWGDSVCQAIMDAIKNADEAQAGFAALIKEAKIDIIGIPGLMNNVGTAEYEQRLMVRLQIAQQAKSIHNALVTDAGTGEKGQSETWQQRQINWAGMPDMIASYLGIVAGAADIPATRLLGKAPDGMNSTGESDQDNYLQMISARQEADLGPALMQLDEVLIRSATGTRDPDVTYSWAPLRVLGDVEMATVNKTKADTVVAILGTGLVPEPAMARAVQNMLVEDQWLPGLDGALAEIPEDERFPTSTINEDFNEGVEAPIDEPEPLRRAANDARKRWAEIEDEE